MINIAYVYQQNAANPLVQSGRPASILRELTAMGATVHPVFPMETRMSRGSKFKKAFYRMSGRHYRGDREPGFLSAIASEFKQRTQRMAYDFVFSPGSEAISGLDISRPIAFCADATFANMIDYYCDFSRLSAAYIRNGHRQEKAALRRAARAIYPSEWAANSALEFYQADPAKVAVIPFGANLGAQNRREQVQGWIANRPFDRLRLLFVGRSWARKGGDLVIETAQRLVAKGFAVKLDLVTSEVPHRLSGMPWITQHGLLDPNLPDTTAVLGDLFKAAHFVFVPSRAEAYGMTFAEASAFGVPAIGTATGGISSVVRNGVNGFTLPLYAKAAEFADLIAGTISRPEQYRELCRNSFDEFEQRLNWRTFCARFLDLAHRCCEGTPKKAEDCA